VECEGRIEEKRGREGVREIEMKGEGGERLGGERGVGGEGGEWGMQGGWEWRMGGESGIREGMGGGGVVCEGGPVDIGERSCGRI